MAWYPIDSNSSPLAYYSITSLNDPYLALLAWIIRYSGESLDAGLVIRVDIEVIADLSYRASVLYSSCNPIEFAVIDDLLVSYIPVLGMYRLYRCIFEYRESCPYTYTALASR